MGVARVVTPGSLGGVMGSFVCCFRSYQNLWLYQDRYWFVSVRTHRYFIVLPHWETRLPAPLSHIWLSHIILRRRQSLHYPMNVEHLARRWQVYIFKSLVWLVPSANKWGPNPLISQSRRQTLYSFSHPIWFLCLADWLILSQAQQFRSSSPQCNWCYAQDPVMHIIVVKPTLWFAITLTSLNWRIVQVDTD